MKKTILFFALFFCEKMIAQTPLSDAWALRENFVKTDKEGEYRLKWKDSASMSNTIEILMKYNASNIQTTNQLEKIFEENPILLIEKIPQSAFRFDPTATFKMTSQRLPGAPGLGVTNLADGLAKFLVKRTKEELTLAFFSKFRTSLRKYPEFEITFPSTFDLMVLLDGEIYNYNSYLDGLRTAFIKDMKVLPTNLQSLVRTRASAENVGLTLALEDLLSIGQAFVDERRPYEIFQFMASESAAIQQKNRVDSIKNDNVRRQVRDLASSLRLTNLLSESLRNQTGQTLWFDQKEAMTMLSDDRVRHIFLGLMWQNAAQIEFSDGTLFRTEIAKMSGKITKFEVFLAEIKAFLGEATTVENTLKTAQHDLQNTAETGIVYDEVDRYFNTFVKLMNVGFRIYRKVEKPENAQDLTRQFVRSMKWVKELYFDVRQAHFTSAIADASFLLTEIYGEKWSARQSFMRYGNFMATVSEAKSSDEMAAAIESFAYPAGSSRLKKHSEVSLGLNAYPGLGLRIDPTGSDNSAKSSFFIPASVGFTANAGFARIGSLSIYLPIIDIGALFAFRFKDGETSIQPKLVWENIISPGGYLVYGFGRDLPISVGVGGQVAPSLKKVLPDGSVLFDNRREFRPNIFLSMDIPITHFYTK
jgi:hypothetical protein